MGGESCRGLISTYFLDILEQLGVDEEEQEPIDLQPVLLSKRDRAVLGLFRTMSPDILLALHSVGKASEKNEPFSDSVSALADLANSLEKGPLQPHRFRAQIKIPSGGKQLIGGALGDLIQDLYE